MAETRECASAHVTGHTMAAWIMVAAAAAVWAPISSAHHSSAMFDHDRQVELVGVVTQFQWTNPHCWIQVNATADGLTQEWSVEMGSPAELFRAGWRPATLKVGDEIRVVVYPTRDTSHAGLFISATGAAGNALGKQV